MKIKVDSIILKKRIRENMGDIESLKESFKKYGQLSPIIINRKCELIAGHRRLEAARRLGWDTIEASIVDREAEADKLEIELEENMRRLNLNPEEISQGLLRLKHLMQPNLIQRILRFFKKLINIILRKRD